VLLAQSVHREVRDVTVAVVALVPNETVDHIG